VRSSGDYREQLIRQLQGAYSGELAAGHAYRGHWRSVRDARQRERIQIIENEEWHHRQLVGELLRELDAGPNRLREIIFWLIGKSIAAFCFVGGWFIPMYGAGRLERGNIVEYEEAAAYAFLCGHPEMIDCLLTMAEVEWEHESYFRNIMAGHWMLRWIPVWSAPPPKESIRSKHAAFEATRRAVA
jgi:rubrerythrin